MKRIVLLAGILCSMGMGYAQKLKHPDLLYTSERIELVKQRIGQEERMSSAWNEIRQTAEKELKENSLNKGRLPFTCLSDDGRQGVCRQVEGNLVQGHRSRQLGQRGDAGPQAGVAQ